MVGSSPLLLAMILILIHRAKSTRAVSDALLAALFTAFIAASAYDNAVLMVNALFGRVYVAHYVGLLFFATVAWLLTQQHVQAVRAHEALNQSLEARLAQREAELQMRFEEARSLEAERTALAERARIMRDLHDGVGAQLLTAISEVEHGATDADRIRDTLTACLDDLRLVVDSLEPHDNYLTTILGTLRYRLAPRLARAGLTMQWEVEEVNPLTWLDPTRTLHLLRILQEAIANVLRHAQATTLLIRLHRGVAGVLVEVRDNGRGFDTRIESGPGHGLRNLRLRAVQLGAGLQINSTPQGTSVTLLLPN
jgi:signal transduction histidine kinase